MGRNFVLKEAGGAPGGYLTQGLGRLRCGIKGGQEGELTLLYADGGEARRRVCAGAESEWADDGRAILAAYAEVGARALFTCERGRRAWEKKQNARLLGRVAVAAPQQGAPGERAGDAQEPQEAQEPQQAAMAPEPGDAQPETPGGEAARAWPEPRWPAPPCWPGARYVNGRWEEA